GQIDEVAYYNRALSAGEVQTYVAGANSGITGSGVINNTGVVEKNAGGGVTAINIPFNNQNIVVATGAVNVYSGTLQLNGGGSSTGGIFTTGPTDVLHPSTIGTLEFSSGDYTLDDGTLLEGSGSIRIDGGTVHIQGLVSNDSPGLELDAGGILTGPGHLEI